MDTNKKTLTSLFLHGFTLLWSSLISHPLHFLLFLFLSPYLPTLLSFLSPLLLTTSLLLLALYTILHDNYFPSQSSSSSSSIHHFFSHFLPSPHHRHEHEALELYNSVFHTSIVDDDDFPQEKILQAVESSIMKATIMNDDTINKGVEKITAEPQPTVKDTDHDKFVTPGECLGDSGGRESVNLLGSCGSMRREKEWKRTLACKLFEERHNKKSAGDGEEGMDLLWEAYETTEASTLRKPDAVTKAAKKEESREEGGVHRDFFRKEYNEEEEEEDDDDEEVDRQRLCCLQALKFSAGKMNMGVGKRNLVRFSKAVKGFGWLHHVSKLRKKVHHGHSS